MQRITALWQKGLRGKVAVGMGAFVIACCVLGALVRQPQQQAAPAAADTAPVTSVPRPTDAPEPTAPPEPTAAPTATPEPPSVGAIGERLEGNGVALTVLGVERVEAIGQFQKAEAGNVFIVAEVLIEGVGTDEAPYNPFYFNVKDADGFEYATALYTGERALRSGELRSGEKARGFVAFEIKADAQGLILVYEPIIIGNTEPIEVALE